MSLLTLSLLLIPIGLLTSYILAYIRSPLKDIPGPFLAKFSDLWRFFNHYSRSHIETQKALHEKYGDTVRLGPNVVSLTDPALVKKIYEARGTFKKSEYYAINDALQGGHIIPNIFSTRSNEFHARALKPVQKLYSHKSALELESLMDDNVRAWGAELETRYMTGANAGKTCDIADWISFFAYDFLGDITFSKRLGFIEAGKDVGNMIQSAENVMGYFSVVGQIPQLDKFLGKNPYASYFPYKFADFAVPATFCVQRFMERVQNPSEYKEKKDFMNGFLAAKEEYPDLVSDNEIIGYMMLNILGGADTTAILLKALVYHLLKNPSVQSTLVRELRAARSTSNIPPSVPLPHSLYSTLPYLQACIAESLRFHPVVGHILERVVPSSGLALSNGTILPPGTIVGINPWILTRDEKVYGERAEDFVPERWLKRKNESEVEFEERIKIMKEVDLAWGGGNRTCLGRPLALVELGKVAASLFGGYDIELEDPSQEWELHKQWFVWPHKIRVKMTKA